jgi:hypothetical protein
MRAFRVGTRARRGVDEAEMGNNKSNDDVMARSQVAYRLAE